MLLLIMLASQAGPQIGPPPAARLAARRECRSEEIAGEVVVCGRTSDEFRLKPLPDRYKAGGVPRAEVALPGGAKAAARTEQGDVGGIPTSRLMLDLRIPL